jgi:hypothetical protein
MPTKPAVPALIPSLSLREFLLRGLLGSLLGSCIGVLNAILLVGIFDTGYLSNRPLYEPVLLGLCGIIAGAIQGGFLRRTTQPALLWLLLSGLGWSLVGLVDSQDTIAWSRTGNYTADGLLFGALVALPQCLRLLPQSLRFAALWFLLSVSIWSFLRLL